MVRLTKIFWVLALGLLLAASWSCKQKGQTAGPAPSQAAIDKNKLCRDGGATFDEAANTCVCPQQRFWDGNQCVAGSGMTACTSSGGRWDEASMRCDCPNDGRLVNGRCDEPMDEEDLAKLCREDGGDWQGNDCDCGSNKEWTGQRCRDEDTDDFSWGRVQEICDDAGGEWDRDERYCECPGTEVLSSGDCVDLTRGLTRSVCEDAVFPGSWLSRRCRCEDDDFSFSTSRGGCVPTQEDADEDILENICESSINDGKWDSTAERCDCPAGQLWHQEQCPEQSDLSSREVCESSFNDGAWSTDDKVCQCPVGSMWIDQSCRDIQDVSERDACTSEFNSGQWDPVLGTCVCPNNEGWIPSVKRCDNDGVSAAQQLCIQSGGRPQADTGGCNCPSGLVVRTLQPQNYQYCVRNDSSDDVPLWLLILLGIVEG